MKSKTLLLVLLMAVFAPWAANAQGTLTIGDGTDYAVHNGGNSGSPIGDTYYYYAATQFIYKASELGGAKTITSLAFYHNDGSMEATINIYLAHTTASTVDANNPATTGTLVYTGTNISIGSSNADWQVFDFSSTPFEYNGTDNLLVIVCRTKTTGYGSSYNSMMGWQYTTTSDNKFMQRNSDDSGVDVLTNTSNYTAYANRPNIKIGFVTTEPYILLAPTSATVKTGFTETLTATYGNVTGTPTITYSSSNTNVATVTGTGSTATVTGVSAGTATITATMNGTYTATCDITVEDPSYCQPYFSTPSDDYISHFATTGGFTNIDNSTTYETGGYSNYYDSYAASIGVGETLTCTVTPSTTQWPYGHAIWVDWNNDYVFADDEKVAYTSSVAKGNWTGSFEVPSTIAAGDYRMRVIHLYNNNPTDPCMSASYGEAEDYKLTVLSCVPPTNVTASNITANSADISWTGNDNATSYNLRYKSFFLEDFENGMGDWTTIDADGDGYTWVLGTEAEVYTNSGNFFGEGYNSSNDLIVSGSFTNNGGQVLHPDNYLVSPKINLGGTISFYAHGFNMLYVAEHFGVFVSTNSNNNPNDFVMVKEWTATTTDFIQYTADLSAYSGQGYVAIRHFNCYDQYLLSIDNIAITEPDAVQPWTLIEDVTSPYTIEGLTPGISYNVEVQTVNADGESTWVPTTFTTLTPTVTLTDGQNLSDSELKNYKGQQCNVNYSRSFTNGITSTVCLPFAYAPKAGEKFYTFNGVSYNEGTQQWVADMTQEAGATLEANKPYLFLPSATGDMDFSGTYTIPASLEPVATTSGDWTFRGTYTQLTYPNAAFVSDYVYGFAGVAQDASGSQDAVVAGEFVRAGDGSTFPAMRCYLKRDSELQAIGHRAAAIPDRIVVRLHDADGHVTSIGGQLTVKDEPAQCYTLDGRLVNGQPTQKGVYVKNGKKVVIK